MDDLNHASSHREDLGQSRKAKFGCHKSYAYGDGAKSLTFGQQPQQQQPKRNTAPSAPHSLFAAATAARSRRGGNGLMMLVEDDARRGWHGSRRQPLPASDQGHHIQKGRRSRAIVSFVQKHMVLPAWPIDVIIMTT
jgi:hypothetical protein